MTEHYKHADCDQAILEDRLDDACEGCKNGTTEPPISKKAKPSSLRMEIEVTRNGEMLKGYPFALTLSSVDTLDIRDDSTGLLVRIKGSESGSDEPLDPTPVEVAE